MRVASLPALPMIEELGGASPSVICVFLGQSLGRPNSFVLAQKEDP